MNKRFFDDCDCCCNDSDNYNHYCDCSHDQRPVVVRGPMGPQGPQGLTGATGATGPAGAPGGVLGFAWQCGSIDYHTTCGRN